MGIGHVTGNVMHMSIRRTMIKLGLTKYGIFSSRVSAHSFTVGFDGGEILQRQIKI